jgi:hypothetical protein
MAAQQALDLASHRSLNPTLDQAVQSVGALVDQFQVVSLVIGTTAVFVVDDLPGRWYSDEGDRHESVDPHLFGSPVFVCEG